VKPRGAKLKDVGGKMTDVGKGMSMKLTAPIMAVGAAAAKVGRTLRLACPRWVLFPALPVKT